MKSSLLLLFCVLSIFAKAQEKPAAYALDEEYNLWNFRKADTAYIFADLAYIRDCPNLEARVIDSLIQGNQVIIKSQTRNGSRSIQLGPLLKKPFFEKKNAFLLKFQFC